MKTVAIREIKTISERFSQENIKWHFHILTPECQLNDTDQYALVLENVTDQEAWVCYSSQPYMNIGHELVKLLHGDDVMHKNEENHISPPSPQVQQLLNRAKEMNDQGKFWHHHMLFPGCRYNQHAEKFVIIFEDQEIGQTIESITETEPKSDLQHIEGLFYAQKK